MSKATSLGYIEVDNYDWPVIKRFGFVSGGTVYAVVQGHHGPRVVEKVLGVPGWKWSKKAELLDDL